MALSVELPVAPRYLADLCVWAGSADGLRQSDSALSGAILGPDSQKNLTTNLGQT